MLKIPDPPNYDKVIYFDNNATTQMNPEAEETMTKWLSSAANPSSDSKISQHTREAIEKCQQFILKHCNLTAEEVKKSLSEEGDDIFSGFHVIFTGSACESNCLIIKSTVEAYKKAFPHKIPHVITSSIEHKSIMECCKELENRGMAKVTYMAPNIFGCVNYQRVEENINDNTCLITIMHANNELGTVNNIYKIAEIANRREIPFHSDCVQTFGKYRIELNFNEGANKINAISASFHKFYGPMGLGLLIVDKEFSEGYQLKGQILGSQQHGLRGGTENVPAIMGGTKALSLAFNSKGEKGIAKGLELKTTPIRREKNSHLLDLSIMLLQLLEKEGTSKKLFDFIKYSDFLKMKIVHEKTERTPFEFPNEKRYPYRICVLGAEDSDDVKRWERTLPNTILMSVFPNVCNIKLKKALEELGNVVVSIGSACNTSSEFASHVLNAIKAPPEIKKGVIRISFGDNNSKKEVEKFVTTFCKALSRSSD